LFLVSNTGVGVLGHAAAIAGIFGYIMYIYSPPLVSDCAACGGTSLVGGSLGRSADSIAEKKRDRKPKGYGLGVSADS